MSVAYLLCLFRSPDEAAVAPLKTTTAPRFLLPRQASNYNIISAQFRGIFVCADLGSFEQSNVRIFDELSIDMKPF